MTHVTRESVLPVENIFPQKSPTGITESRVTSVTEAFPVGSRVRLAAASQWVGEVVGHEADGTVKIQFQVFDLSVVGRHNPAVVERIEP